MTVSTPVSDVTLPQVPHTAPMTGTTVVTVRCPALKQTKE